MDNDRVCAKSDKAYAIMPSLLSPSSSLEDYVWEHPIRVHKLGFLVQSHDQDDPQGHCQSIDQLRSFLQLFEVRFLRLAMNQDIGYRRTGKIMDFEEISRTIWVQGLKKLALSMFSASGDDMFGFLEQLQALEHVEFDNVIILADTDKGSWWSLLHDIRKKLPIQSVTLKECLMTYREGDGWCICCTPRTMSFVFNFTEGGHTEDDIDRIIVDWEMKVDEASHKCETKGDVYLSSED